MAKGTKLKETDLRIFKTVSAATWEYVCVNFNTTEGSVQFLQHGKDINQKITVEKLIKFKNLGPSSLKDKFQLGNNDPITMVEYHCSLLSLSIGNLNSEYIPGQGY